MCYITQTKGGSQKALTYGLLTPRLDGLIVANPCLLRAVVSDTIFTKLFTAQKVYRSSFPQEDVMWHAWWEMPTSSEMLCSHVI